LTDSTATIPQAPVTTEGFVVPSLFSKMFHIFGILCGLAIEVGSLIHPSYHVSSSGQVGGGVSGAILIASTVWSYMTHEKSLSQTTAIKIALDTATAEKQVESIDPALVSKVKDFIENDADPLKGDVSAALDDVESFKTDAASKIEALSQKIDDLPVSVAVPVEDFEKKFEDAFEKNFPGLAALAAAMSKTPATPDLV
jgi:hypothetical protein